MAYTRKTADLHICEDFVQIMEKIKDDSQVAKLLTKRRHPIETLVDNFVDYISVSKSDPTKISYLTQDRFDKVDGDFWNSSRRYMAKPGAFVSKIFKDIEQSEIEKFSNLFRMVQTAPSYTFKIVEGDEVAACYHHSRYSRDCSSLGASCMKHTSCQKYLSIYTKNPDKIKLCVMVNQTDEVMGRALLWNLPEYKIMDRIYSVDDDALQPLFKQWANKNGYLYKKQQSWNNSLFFEGNGQTHRLEIGAKLANFDFEFYPYVDTFKFLDESTGTFYNYKPKDLKLTLLNGTDGYTNEASGMNLCVVSSIFYNNHELVELPYLNAHCLDRYAVWSNQNDTHILKDDAQRHEKFGWIFKDIEKNVPEVQTQLRSVVAQEEQHRRFFGQSGKFVRQMLHPRIPH